MELRSEQIYKRACNAKQEEIELLEAEFNKAKADEWRDLSQVKRDFRRVFPACMHDYATETEIKMSVGEYAWTLLRKYHELQLCGISNGEKLYTAMF